MVAGPHEFESECLESTQNSIIGRINGKLNVEEEKGSGGNGSLGHKRLKHWIVLGGCECRRAKGLDVEDDCGADIRKRRPVSVALADDCATRKAKRISDVASECCSTTDFSCGVMFEG